MDTVSFLAAVFLLGGIVECNFILTGLAYPTGTKPTTVALRGEDPGNVWNPPIKGANRVPCGGLHDLKTTYGTRVAVPTGGEFTVAGSVINSRGRGSLALQIKYGNSADFSFSPGFPLALDPAQNFTLPTNFTVGIQLTSKYSGDATVQVAYIAGSNRYYQCIDLTVTAKTPFPSGYLYGFGPVEEAEESHQELDSVTTTGEEWKEKVGLSDFHIALIVLVPLFCLVAIYLCYRTHYPGVGGALIEKQAAISRDLPPEPFFTKTQKSSSGESPLPTTKTTPSRTDDNDEGEGDDPRGAHFHFQYV